MSLDQWVETTGPATPDKQSGTICIDFSQIALSTVMATYNPNEVTGEDADLLVKHAILASIKQNVRRFRGKGYDEIVICVDSADGGYWRRDVAPCYKRNRKKGREESPWDFATIYRIMDDLLDDIRENFPWKVLKIPRCEADDIIGTLTPFLVEKVGKSVLIISSDGDFTQLQDVGNVDQWSPMHKKFVKPKHGNSYADLIVKIAKGDKKDNVGPYQEVVHHYETGRRAKPVTKKMLEQLTDDWKSVVSEKDRPRWAQNMELLDLRRVPEEYKDQIMEQYHSVKPARSRVYQYLAKNKMVKLLNDVDSFEVKP